jgi:hypothetical protein
MWTVGMARRSARPVEAQPSDRGAAVVDFVLVGVLTIFLFSGLLQLMLVMHVHNVLIDSAEQGARLGALADRNPAAGASRTRELIRADLSSRYAGDVSAGEERVQGLDTIEVRVRAPMPILGLFGAGHLLTVSGHALADPP